MQPESFTISVLMSKPFSFFLRAGCLVWLLLFVVAHFAYAQQFDPSTYAGLRWRMIGPFRGGRSIAVSGVEGQPNVYYFGSVGGGVWKSTNAGETWEPIFDSQPIASIGALAVAPSNPNVIYAGSGEADFRSDLTYGNGVYKSTDGGKSWAIIGLRDSRHIGRVVVDPHNPDIVLVAALGEAYGPSAERGVYRSTDGGRNWQRVLFKYDNIGAIDIAPDPDNFQTMFASLVNDRRPPWSTYAPTTTAGAIYKSTDGGATWKQITGGGLPAGEWGRIGLAVARGTHGQRVYAFIDNNDPKGRGLFRSDDGGKTWAMTGTDQRPLSRGWYFGEVTVDPKDPNTVYMPNVSIYRSTDAGKTFVAIKGAPGGDDYHSLWIDPSNPKRMIFGSDQGVGISVDGGRTWSSWYNQPTAQFYHVTVDNQFPYHVYGAQQDSGSVETTSRSNEGSITFRDWQPTAAGESGYIAPDPGDSTKVYGGDTFGELFKQDKRTGQTQVIAPEAVRTFGDPTKAELRFSWTSPLVFSPQDRHTLYYGSQYVLKTANGGQSWERISPDLTGIDTAAAHDGPTTVQNAKQRGHGVIYTIAPSSVEAGLIWVGTDTGLIHLTRDDGKTWTNVTPTGLPEWSKISLIDASPIDAGTAYAAVDRHRLSDLSPWIFRTQDFGKTWTRINTGIPNGAYVRAVRADYVRKGLLFAGTELGVFVSFNDGDSWQSLKLNMPTASVHDLVIKDNDLVIATHGRSFWILDDISPLRQITQEIAGEPFHLFHPADAIRIRPSTNKDTPLPPEVPAGQNPPPGAILYYYLKSQTQSEVKLEILDSRAKVVRSYSSNDKPWTPAGPPPFTNQWFQPAEQVSTQPGTHRFLWDLHYAPPDTPAGIKESPGYSESYSMSTAYGLNVPHEPQGPMALPGSYQVRLTIDGKSYMQPLKLAQDPRVLVPSADLEKEFALQTKISEGIRRANEALDEIGRERHRTVLGGGNADRQKALAEIEPVMDRGARPSGPTLSGIRGALVQIAVQLDAVDASPTSQQTAAAVKALADLDSLLKKYEPLRY
jgi:photosystem II stability/assembly factor-like uncharacterized protein